MKRRTAMDAQGCRSISRIGARSRIRSFVCAASCFATCAALGLSRPVHADGAIDAFLERHGMYELLALSFEERIERVAEVDRDELVVRLAALYASLLEAERDESNRARLEERSRRLLTLAPPDKADELRLALLRASYVRAEEIAERHRLRMATSDEMAFARTTLDQTVPELQRLVRHYDAAMQSTNARLSRAAGAEVEALYDRLDRLERLRRSCRFLLAWSLYYRAWLDGSTDTSGPERLFAESLLSDVVRPQPEDISTDLRAFEPTARSIIGMAMCKSLSSTNSAMALRWIALLDDEQTFDAVRAQAPGWTLAIRLEHDEYDRAFALLEEQREMRGELPVQWLRLAAVGGLEATTNEAAARRLVEFAVTRLAAIGDLQQILDLAERYGAETLGSSGFAVRYVNGVLAYREARAMDESGDSVPARERYEHAITELERALRQPDAEGHADAQAACLRLIAWARYFSGDYAGASEVFETAATESGGDDDGEALWMAIVSLDRVIADESRDNAERTAQREALAARFLREYPADPRAATLLVNRAVAAESLSDAEIRRLLAIDPAHESYYPARRRIAQALYQRFRDTSGEARLEARDAFLGVSTPLLDAPRAFGAQDDPAAISRRLVHVRRVLEVGLHPPSDPHYAAAARKAIEVFREIESLSPDAASTHRDEIEYRRIQERLVMGDFERAALLADALWERGESEPDIWARLAVRTMFQYANALVSARGDSHMSEVEALRMVLRHGRRVLSEYDHDPSELREMNVLAFHAAVANASFLLWQDHGHEGEGPRAFVLYARMIERHPRQPALLRPAAILAAALEKHEAAARFWRTLAAGSPPGGEAWFESRLGLMTALAELDPAQARAVMEQHRLLYPDYGPPPWGDQLRTLDERLLAEVRGRRPRASRDRGEAR